MKKKTYDRKVRHFIKSCRSLWKRLDAFVKANCKGRSARKKEEFLDEACEIIDGFSLVTAGIYRWCHRNGMSVSKVAREVNCSIWDDETTASSPKVWKRE